MSRVATGRRPVRRDRRRRADRSRPRDRGVRRPSGPSGPRVLPRARSRRSCSSIRASTATRRSCARAACSWSAPGTPGPTSRSRSSEPTRRGCPDPIAVTSPSTSTGGSARYVIIRVFRFVRHHVLTLRTPLGRKAKRKFASQGDMLVRVKPKWLVAGGRRARAEDGRCPGREAGARGRTGPRRHERDLVHRVPARPLVDRSPDLRRGRGTPARARRGRDERSPACTSSACRSSTRRAPTCSPAWAGTRSTS